MKTPKRRPRRHVGQWIEVDGQPAHILADPNVSPETMAAFEELIRCARKAIEDETFEDETLPGMKNYKPKDEPA